MSGLERLRGRIPDERAKRVYAYVLERSVASRAELAEACRLTPSTLTRLLADLVRNGLLEEAGEGESSGGRKPLLYRINPRYAFVFGLEISRLVSRLALFDMALRRIAHRSWPMTADMTPDRLFDEAATAAKGMLEACGLAAGDVLGCGVAAVGPLDRKTGVMLRPLHFPAPGWSDVPVVERLERLLGVPVVLDNGANAALLGEWWFDPDRSARHLLYVHVGAGIRSAMMADGDIVYGAVDTEGTAGQIVIRADGIPPRVPGGNYGALESYVSVPALEERARAGLKEGRDSVMAELAPGGDPEQVRLEHVLEAVRSGDPFAVELLTQAATDFGIGLANMLNVLHPEKVILGGPLATGHPIFFRTAVRVARAKTYYDAVCPVAFAVGRLGEEAQATGAAALVIRAMIGRDR
ncbi:MAG: sugar kinase [Candidatus Reconcilbacillus cellulovorans]|uniref:Sugar kinase n=1 Tax=Candidatus Reconcilbacillus cellulovorans TaxID=1906605 RepID=A0A2A6DXT9_9BACL|nr:MAG: sugar kinase [Candidatus Reconcilbacillus cellulovorans]